MDCTCGSRHLHARRGFEQLSVQFIADDEHKLILQTDSNTKVIGNTQPNLNHHLAMKLKRNKLTEPTPSLNVRDVFFEVAKATFQKSRRSILFAGI